jgi:sec-independent protein translocase protein TatA
MPGLPELLVILVIVVILFGIGRIGRLGGELGSAIGNFRKGVREADDEGKNKNEETV